MQVHYEYTRTSIYPHVRSPIYVRSHRSKSTHIHIHTVFCCWLCSHTHLSTYNACCQLKLRSSTFGSQLGDQSSFSIYLFLLLLFVFLQQTSDRYTYLLIGVCICVRFQYMMVVVWKADTHSVSHISFSVHFCTQFLVSLVWTKFQVHNVHDRGKKFFYNRQDVKWNQSWCKLISLLVFGGKIHRPIEQRKRKWRWCQLAKVFLFVEL